MKPLPSVILLVALSMGSMWENPAAGQTPDASFFRTERLSERVLILTEISPMENIVVALATERGIVVVDATGSPVTAETLRSLIVDAFGRDDFTYVVQTHCHWDHAWGNRVFEEARVVAHEDCGNTIGRDRTRVPDILSRRSQALQELNGRLGGLAPGTPERATLQRERDFMDRTVRGMEGDFDIRDPDVTFRDVMELDLGDMTFRLTYFGRAHSGNDALIQVPEEELLFTGDLFLDIGWLPLFAGLDTLDIPRWIDVLGRALDGSGPVSTVIPGHREPWEPEKLNLWREYIVDLWAGVNAAKDRGATLEEALADLPMDDRLEYVKELGHTDEALARFHRSNVEAFWRQLGAGLSFSSP